MAPKPRIFLDTSAIFAGIWSSEGGGRMILKLGEASALKLTTSLCGEEIIDPSNIQAHKMNLGNMDIKKRKLISAMNN